MEGCQYCSSANYCTGCYGGYYLSSGRCYSCSSKFGENCVLCNSSECLSCKEGYWRNGSVCALNDNKFSCSDENFMKVGNLCITRKNMGDSSVLKIPSGIVVVEIKEYCYSQNEKCCWRELTAGFCNNENGGYSGCDRTVCNYSAAQEICSKFNFQGKRWRLATIDEMKNRMTYSVGLGTNGLMICDYASGYSMAKCYIKNKLVLEQIFQIMPVILILFGAVALVMLCILKQEAQNQDIIPQVCIVIYSLFQSDA